MTPVASLPAAGQETQDQADDAQCDSAWDLIATPEPRYTHFKMGDCELWLPTTMTPQDYDDVLALLQIFHRRAEKAAKAAGAISEDQTPQ